MEHYNIEKQVYLFTDKLRRFDLDFLGISQTWRKHTIRYYKFISSDMKGGVYRPKVGLMAKKKLLSVS